MDSFNKAKEYTDGKVVDALNQVVADAYMAGYNAGYQDGYNKVVKDSVSEGSEFVDLGLPSGTLWSSDYVKDDNTLVIVGLQTNFSRHKRLCRGYVFCTIWIYHYVRMVSHYDNRNDSASKK